MDQEKSHQFARQIFEALPQWLVDDPRLRQDLLQALGTKDGLPPRFDTFEAFIEWVDEDMSAEWDDGEVIFMSPASLQHQLLVGFLNAILSVYIQTTDSGLVLQAPFKMKLDRYGPEPDLIFVSKEHLYRLQDNFLDGPADFVIEVISPESITRDRSKKFLAYEAAGIREYWMLDLTRNHADFYQLDANGRYQLMPIENGRFQSNVLPGFWLQTAWLWQSPLPHALDILRQLKII